MCVCYQAVGFQELRSGGVVLGAEVDVVGIVVHLCQPNNFNREGGGCGVVQTVYLSDAQIQMLAIKFWGGLQVGY